MREMLDLVGDIYEASWNPGHWHEVLRRLCNEVLDAKSAVIAVDDFQLRRRSYLGSWGAPKRFEMAYRFGLGRYDIAFQLQADQPEGVARQFVDHRTLREAHPLYYSLMLKPNNVGYIAGMTLYQNEEWYVGLGVHRGMDGRPFSDEEVARIQMLYPHLKRAVRIHKEFHRLRERQQKLSSALSKLTLGVLVLSAEGRVVYRNPMVEAVLNRHPGLMVVQERLRAYLPEEQARLMDMLGSLSRSGPREGVVRPQAMGIHHPEQELPLTLIAAPMEDALESVPGEHGQGCIVVYLSDPESPQNVQAESLQAVYGMSHAEAKVAIGLANGLSLEQIGRHNGVSVETVRSQLKGVFRHMGVNRQQDVVRLVLSGVA